MRQKSASFLVCRAGSRPTRRSAPTGRPRPLCPCLHLPDGVQDGRLRLGQGAGDGAARGGRVAAAPQPGAHLGGVEPAAGADGQLAAPLRQLPDGDGGLHPLNLSQEGGDILHILLSCVRLVHEGQGHGGHSDFPVLIAVHPLGEQPLHLKPRPALGAEVALIEREQELEEKIEDAKLRRDAIKQQAITLENIYKIMVNFDCVYNIINDEEKRNVVTALIKEIEIYRNDESEYPLKRIGLNFPVFKDGGEVTELLWDKGNTVETAVLLQRKDM